MMTPALKPQDVATRLDCTARQALGVMRVAGGFYVGRREMRIHEERLARFMTGTLELASVRLKDAGYRVSVVYFIQGADMIKIGWSNNIAQRIATLTIASPVALKIQALVSGAVDLEAALHARFAALHAHGEWFRFEGDLRRLVDRLSEQDDSYKDKES